MYSIKIIMESRSEQDIKNTSNTLQSSLLKEGISHTGLIPLGNTRKKFTVNTSPHVNSKSKEEIHTIIRKYMIQATLKEKENLAFLNKIHDSCPPSVSISLKEKVMKK